MNLIVVLAMIPLGLIVGGFVTMVATRVPDERAVFSPGPECPACERRLGLSEIIPIVSWLRQGRACNGCGLTISMSYPLAEVVTAGLFVAGATQLHGWLLVPHLVLFAALVAISITDLYLYRIPDRIVFPTLGVSVIMLVALAFYYGRPELILSALFGMVLYCGVLFIMHVILPAGMGFGDVKLALLLGLFLGFNGTSVLHGTLLVFYSLVIASMIATVGGGLLILARKNGYDPLPDPLLDADEQPEDDDAELGSVGVGDSGKLHTGLPFGPPLALGTIIAILFAAELLG